MIIGVPKEIKLQEHRIGLTPDSVKILTNKGHEVLVQDNGGFEAGFTNENYKDAGAKIEKEAKEIFNFSKEIDIVGIDETQFFDLSIIDVCNKLANDGKRVIVAGLDRDYKSIPFKPMANLLAHAEKITKLSSICIVCGDYAYFSQRLTDDKTQILVGETDEYEARCRKCFKP